MTSEQLETVRQIFHRSCDHVRAIRVLVFTADAHDLPALLQQCDQMEATLEQLGNDIQEAVCRTWLRRDHNPSFKAKGIQVQRSAVDGRRPDERPRADKGSGRWNPGGRKQQWSGGVRRAQESPLPESQPA